MYFSVCVCLCVGEGVAEDTCCSFYESSFSFSSYLPVLVHIRFFALLVGQGMSTFWMHMNWFRCIISKTVHFHQYSSFITHVLSFVTWCRDICSS